MSISKSQKKFTFDPATEPSDDHQTYTSSEEAETKEVDYYACGEDMEVLEMSLEDSMKCLDPNSVHYLTDCRTKLIQKVAQYRQQLETSTSNNTKLIYKH